MLVAKILATAFSLGEVFLVLLHFGTFNMRNVQHEYISGYLADRGSSGSDFPKVNAKNKTIIGKSQASSTFILRQPGRAPKLNFRDWLEPANISKAKL